MAPRRQATSPLASTCIISGAKVLQERALLAQRKEAGQVGPKLHAPVFRVLLKVFSEGTEFLKRKQMGTTGNKEELNAIIFLIR